MAERVDTTGMAFADRAEAIPMYRPPMTDEERADLYAALEAEADAAHKWFADNARRRHPEGEVMTRPGYDSPIGRQFHGMEGDAPIFDSELLRVDRFSGGRFFVEVGRESGNTKLVNVGHGDLLRMARAILQHFEPPPADPPR